MTKHIHIHVHDNAWEEGKHPRASSGEFSKADHTAAAAHHAERREHHKKEAETRGEDLGTPVPGTHANASSQHGSAAYYHGAAAESLDPGTVKKAHRATSLANSASKKAESGKGYPTEKSNNYTTPTSAPGELQAKRIGRYLSQRHIGPIKR
jgi:hypothetical protein